MSEATKCNVCKDILAGCSCPEESTLTVEGIRDSIWDLVLDCDETEAIEKVDELLQAFEEQVRGEERESIARYEQNKAVKQAFLEMKKALANNKNETLWKDKADNEIMEQSLDAFTEAVTEELTTKHKSN